MEGTEDRYAPAAEIHPFSKLIEGLRQDVHGSTIRNDPYLRWVGKEHFAQNSSKLKQQESLKRTRTYLRTASRLLVMMQEKLNRLIFQNYCYVRILTKLTNALNI